MSINAFVLPTGAYGEPLPLEPLEHLAFADLFLADVGLAAREVTDAEDVEWLRAIRNTCRAGFSNDRAVITAPQQAAWWAAMQGRVVARLYQDRQQFVVGYGLLRFGPTGGEAAGWISSVAVLPGHGGRGYGGAITRHVIRQCPQGRVWASARNDNPAALRLHCAADWDTLGCDNDLTYFRTKPWVHGEGWR